MTADQAARAAEPAVTSDRAAALDYARISAALAAYAAEAGVPPREVGGCARCGTPVHRYGLGGRPLCPSCPPGAAVVPSPASPQDHPAPVAYGSPGAAQCPPRAIGHPRPPAAVLGPLSAPEPAEPGPVQIRDGALYVNGAAVAAGVTPADVTMFGRRVFVRGRQVADLAA